MKKIILFLSLLFAVSLCSAENGYRLWLRYDPISDAGSLAVYKKGLTHIIAEQNTEIINAAKAELITGLSGLLNTKISTGNMVQPGSIIIGTSAFSPVISSLNVTTELNKTGAEGYLILSKIYKGKSCIFIVANADAGVLYGVFHFLRLIQTGQSIADLHIITEPKIELRILDHWDNLNRTIERGYAGASIWNWHTLPGIIEQRYIDYARANASVGINGVVPNNVNANAVILTHDYLLKVAALANIFRPYHIRLYLTARFSAPVEIGGLPTADPLDKAVQQWWKDKADEIYKLIPDFGGFLVKANSEGQPGPQNYGRNHADGANMLADAVAPHNGVVMWRAFVYSSEAPDDRFKQAYNEFKPLDGQFRSNVILQVKNGPLDFQPREPLHPLFGAMAQTALAPEYQLTQEYLGFATHLVYLAPLMKDSESPLHLLNSSGIHFPAIAGVANIGNDVNWCGHPFAQANWYAYGRLAWDAQLSPESIAEEWLRMTFTTDPAFVQPVKRLMLASREAAVHYMTPLGLHHIMGYSHHYGPAPWYDKAPRADWNPVYFHRADSKGIGFDRTAKGSNALAQYPAEVQKKFEEISTCPEDYLLWFHHVSWTYTMHSGHNLWTELCYKYQQGVDSVRWMQRVWNGMQGRIDGERFGLVQQLLAVQESEAEWWRNACLLYFQTFSKMPLPAGVEKADHTLEYYESLRFPYAPGT